MALLAALCQRTGDDLKRGRRKSAHEGLVHIVRKVTARRSRSLGFCRIDSTRFWCLLKCHEFLHIKLRKADSAHHLRRLCKPLTRLSLHAPCPTCVPTNRPDFLLSVHQHQQPGICCYQQIARRNVVQHFLLSLCIFSCLIDSLLACTLCNSCSCRSAPFT